MPRIFGRKISEMGETMHIFTAANPFWRYDGVICVHVYSVVIVRGSAPLFQFEPPPIVWAPPPPIESIKCYFMPK